MEEAGEEGEGIWTEGEGQGQGIRGREMSFEM